MADNKVVVAPENKLVQSRNFVLEVIIVFVVIVALIILAMDASVRGIINLIMGIFAR
jgi:hypothetical protein